MLYVFGGISTEKNTKVLFLDDSNDVWQVMEGVDINISDNGFPVVSPAVKVTREILFC